MAQIIPLIKEQIKTMCYHRGFKPKGYYYAKKISNDYWGLLSFVFATYSDCRSIDVCIGIFNETIHEFSKKIWANSDPKALFWLILPNVGWLNTMNPHREVWYVDDSTDLTKVCNSIFDKVDVISPRFFNEFSDTDSLIKLYENYRSQPWPICLDDVFRILPLLYLSNKQQIKGLNHILYYLSNHECLNQYDLAYVERYTGLLESPLLSEIQPGELFSLITDSGLKHYFQFVAKDTTANDSDVIRIFKKSYPLDAVPSTTEIVDDDVECYMHTMVSWGLYFGLWTRSGFDKNIGRMDISFRRSKDYGRFSLNKKRVSNNWEIWTINTPKQVVGILPKDYYSANIGDIGSPSMVLKRINEGYFPNPWYPLFTNGDE